MSHAPWPHDTLEKLREAGYSYQERSKCLSPQCTTVAHWFITPKGKWMPFEIVAGVTHNGEPTYRPHFSTCPEARKFSRKSKDHVEERKATA
jgi:hypothetical protein